MCEQQTHSFTLLRKDYVIIATVKEAVFCRLVLLFLIILSLLVSFLHRSKQISQFDSRQGKLIFLFSVTTGSSLMYVRPI